jgi:hypothetical protein
MRIKSNHLVQPSSLPSPNTSGIISETTDAEDFFNSFYVPADENRNINRDIESLNLIENISFQTRQPFDSNPIEYYKKNYTGEKIILYELAVTVFSGPGSQASVERSYNYMKLLLSPHRLRLNPENVENILFINLNRVLLSHVNFEKISIA